MIKFDELQKWLLVTPYGQYILHHEEVFYHNILKHVFGYYALQLNLPQINFLAKNKIPNQYTINKDIKSNNYFLPFNNNSLDLIICPHILELTPNYYYLLQECYRVLIPNGKIVFTCFNDQSLFKILFKYKYNFNYINFINTSI